MKIAIIGAGNMGGAVARGIESANLGYEVRISNPSQSKLDKIKQEFPHIKTFNSNIECASGGQVVILAVKPWKEKEVIQEIMPALERCPIIVTMVGGSSANKFKSLIDREVSNQNCPKAYYHVIPNTAAALRESMTFVNGTCTTPDSDKIVKEIFDCVGLTKFVDDFQMNAGMAVASCGIAFIMRFMRAMTEGGVELGLKPHDALEAAAMTMKGAAELILRNGEHPEQEVDKVTTAGGITIRGLNAMEENGLSGAIIKGLRACTPK